MKRPIAMQVLLFVLLVAYGSASRLTSSVPNFHAVAAAALFAGFIFRSRLVAVAVPIVSMSLSDLALGMHSPLVMVSVYACLAAPVAAGSLLRGRMSMPGLGAAALASSVLFFAVTNFVHWYAFLPHSWASLGRCYTVALPFFGYTVAGDLAYTAALYAAYCILTAGTTRVPTRVNDCGISLEISRA